MRYMTAADMYERMHEVIQKVGGSTGTDPEAIMAAEVRNESTGNSNKNTEFVEDFGIMNLEERSTSSRSADEDLIIISELEKGLCCRSGDVPEFELFPPPHKSRHHRRRRCPLPSSTSAVTHRLHRSSATPVDRDSPRAPAETIGNAAARYSPPAPLSLRGLLLRHRYSALLSTAAAPTFSPPLAINRAPRPSVLATPRPPVPPTLLGPRSSAACRLLASAILRHRCLGPAPPQQLIALGSSLTEFRVSSVTRGLPLD
ncbi:hypothetical protein Syun_011988 [Stephania yunnanensis]|uniref:Uncharacterized protein n=1 Tax=Stephania yunnanensis TaxID=152371 RepID=A0AAP0JYJ3_9MAGN